MLEVFVAYLVAVDLTAVANSFVASGEAVIESVTSFVAVMPEAVTAVLEKVTC
ncbi:hypothetical protein C1H46_010194 [Malus baccata]|uniref:Uncharacterized protein n=1 Tax=Malus baccata TaxID=106549 RepID=A0A540N0X7_MALBA|nr:hypothetical protein C1H46_010194 [Malus baccata]